MYRNALFAAIEKNNIVAIRDLFLQFRDQRECRSLANCSKPPYGPALHLACRLTDELELVRELLKAGAKLDSTDREGWTPLHIASKKGNLKLVQELLKAGAKLDSTDREGWTPLHIASKKGNLKLVQELLKAGAKLDSVNKEGWSPLDIASLNGNNNNDNDN